MGSRVKQVTPDGMTIRFSGTAATVQSAFHTEIHNLSVNGEPHYANMSDPQIPAALAPVVVGVKALHNFLPQSAAQAGQPGSVQSASGQMAAGREYRGAGSTHRPGPSHPHPR